MSQVLRQAAVIPMADGRVGMVTSSSGRRWVVPKGLIDGGHTAGEAALIEAWEEAGLVGVLGRDPVGSYLYVTEEAVDSPERNVPKREFARQSEGVKLIMARRVAATRAVLDPADG